MALEDMERPLEPKGIPVPQVLALRQQGLTNDQIVQSLQRDGFKVHEIFEAMNQADTKKGVFNIPLKKGDNMVDNPMNPPGAPMAPPPGMPAAPPPAASTVPPAPAVGTAPFSDPYGASDTKMEEMAESIIDEKWQDLIENVKRIVEWKDKTELKLRDFETKIDSLQKNFDLLNTSVLEKVGEYDKNIQVVGTNVAALERVFQKILPGFVENVNELSEISKEFKLARQKAGMKATK